MTQEKEPIIFSIGGGKGGVGKSMVSANLAVQYAQAGLKVILLDLDFGAANIHTIFGIRQPKAGLGNYFTSPKTHLSDYVLDTNIKNLQIVPGSGFVPELANLKYFQKVKLVRHIRQLDADLVLLDLGAGSSYNVIDFFSMSHASIIVTSPEPTAIVNAYEFLKNVVYRVLFRMFRNQDEILEIIKASTVPQNTYDIASIDDLIKVIGKKEPWIAEQIQELCNSLDFYVVFNQARNAENARLGSKLQEICQRYLHLKLNYSGIIFHNEEVSASIFKMSPISVHLPDSITSQVLQRISIQIFNQVAQKMLKGQNNESFEDQLNRVLSHAKKDYAQNLLTQRRIQREIDRSKFVNNSSLNH
ncbi:MAG: hypothetical protein CMO81_05270 [Waddliaceae bacterium]|nr:hypothetical protein [Waddliaceae bacterium]